MKKIKYRGQVVAYYFILYLVISMFCPLFIHISLGYTVELGKLGLWILLYLAFGLTLGVTVAYIPMLIILVGCMIYGHFLKNRELFTGSIISLGIHLLVFFYVYLISFQSLWFFS